MNLTIAEYACFTPPIIGGGIARNGRIDIEVRALTTARLPAFTREGMGAVPRQKPRIVHSNDNGDSSRKRT